MINSNFFPFLYGLLVSTAYVSYKWLDVKGGIFLFSISCLIVSISMFLTSPKRFYLAFSQKGFVKRGFIFSVTQVLIFKGQEFGYTSDVIISSLAGSMIGVLISNLFLKEKIETSIFISLLFCFPVFIYYDASIYSKTLGLVVGVMIALTIVSTRTVMEKQERNLECLFVSVSIGFFVSFIFIALFEDKVHFSIKDVDKYLFSSVILFALQLYYLWMFKRVKASVASVLLLSRVPFSFLLEYLIFNRHITYNLMSISFLIMLASVLPYIKDLKLTRSRLLSYFARK